MLQNFSVLLNRHKSSFFIFRSYLEPTLRALRRLPRPPWWWTGSPSWPALGQGVRGWVRPASGRARSRRWRKGRRRLQSRGIRMEILKKRWVVSLLFSTSNFCYSTWNAATRRKTPISCTNSVWPVKNCQISKKLPKNDFTSKDFDAFTKIA